jgi:hypothetical protein
MSFRSSNITTMAPYLIAALLSAAFVLAISGRPYALAAPRAQAAAKNSDQTKIIARGKYFVEGVAGNSPSMT